MNRRKPLKGVAKNLAQWCLSRNNDYKGYWAPGKLYLYANSVDEKEVRIHVIENFTESFDSRFEVLRVLYSKFIYKNIAALGIKVNCLKNVSVEYSFNVPTIQYGPNVPLRNRIRYYGNGDPFECKVTIECDNGRVYTGFQRLRCRIHDPEKECRRSGF